MNPNELAARLRGLAAARPTHIYAELYRLAAQLELEAARQGRGINAGHPPARQTPRCAPPAIARAAARLRDRLRRGRRI